jgi:hypothetical protein
MRCERERRGPSRVGADAMLAVYCRSVYLTLPPLVDSLPQSSVIPLPHILPPSTLPPSSLPLSSVYRIRWVNITHPSPLATQPHWMMKWRMTLGTLLIGLSPTLAMRSLAPSTPPSISPPSWRTQSPPRGQSSRPTRTCTMIKCAPPSIRFRSLRHSSFPANPMSWARVLHVSLRLPCLPVFGWAWHLRERGSRRSRRRYVVSLARTRGAESHHISRLRCAEHPLTAEPAGDHAALAMSPPNVTTPRSRATKSARIPSSSTLDGRHSSVPRIRPRMVPTMVRKRLVFTGTEEKAKCMGPKNRFVFCTAESIPGAKVGQWAKTRGSYHIEEGEPIEQTVQDASMHRLRKVVPTSERSGDAHE